MTDQEHAYELLKRWRPEYRFGLGITGEIGALAASFGRNVLLVANSGHMEDVVASIAMSIQKAGCACIAAPGVKPNAPRDDVYRLAAYMLQYKPDVVVAVGGGSTIDACKAADVLAVLGEESLEIDSYFGTGKVSEALKKSQKKLIPLVAYATCASSAAHLTKYSNITDFTTGQKKLIVDPAIVPTVPFFDYAVTRSMPASVTIDGAMDAIAHTWEVFCGCKGESFGLCLELVQTAVNLVLHYAPVAVKEPDNLQAREALGLATDLGGYAIMVGGTSGAHLTSFSLIDCCSHGTACGLMNPYYAVYYQKSIQQQLWIVGELFQKHGFMEEDPLMLSERELAEKVASAMMAFSKSLGAPVKLLDLSKFDRNVHLPRALAAAKDPDLKMKLQNMPVPMDACDVDVYMASILEAACCGDLKLVKEKMA